MTEQAGSIANVTPDALVQRSGARRELAMALHERDKKAWRPAVSHYQRYLQTRPDDYAVWVQLGHALKESGRTVEALAAYSEAMRMNDRDSDLLLSFGHLYKVMGLRDEAIAFYRRSAELDGNVNAESELRGLGLVPPAATAWSGPAYPERRSPGLLAGIWRSLAAFYDRHVRRSVAQGDAARARGDWAIAALHYEAHLQVSRQDFGIWVQLGHALKEAGKPVEALAAYRGAASIRDDDPDLLLQLGHIHKVLSRVDEAGEYYRRAIECGEDRAVAELNYLTSLSNTAPIAASTIVTDRATMSLGRSAKILIVAPLYKAPDLIPQLIDSLCALADEISALGAAIVLINDSPDHAGLAASLDIHLPRLRAAAPVELIVNERNLGFVGSANRGMTMALQAGADVLLLNSDAIIAPGSLSELVEVAYSDSMISAVSPRSNNATICNSPYPDRFRSLGPAEALDAHRQIADRLPRVTYVPTAVGFCLYIKRTMIAEFGVFDTVYGGGYNEENDFLLRCNRRGYRAVLANRAYAYHLGSISFSQSATPTSEREAKNHAILVGRYPEYDRSVQRYFAGVDFETQRLLSGIVTNGRRRILFDCRNVGPYHAGTFEYMKRAISAFVRRYQDTYECYISCQHEALVYHAFDKIVGLQYCWNQERELAPFAVAIRLSQPFGRHDIDSLRSLAPVIGFVMLDTIAMDCQYLDDQHLTPLWRHMLETTDMLGYLSDFSRDEFIRRFDVPSDIEQFVALCSTTCSEYSSRSNVAPIARKHILVVGNHYAHKHVYDAIAALRHAGASTPIVALGMETPPELGATGYKAGELSQALVDSLYDQATVMVFPSHFEGFGLPVMHALARQVPVIGRAMPIMEEVRRKTEGAANVYLFETTAEMALAALEAPRWIEGSSNVEPVQSWWSCAGQVADAAERALARLDYANLARRVARAETAR